MESYFSELPTGKELTTLLLMRQNPSLEYVSKYLKVSKRTAQEYKASLNNKLIGTTLSEFLVNLRLRNDNNFNTWE
jgi:hypothetical protein